jgi:hypothetical protein
VEFNVIRGGASTFGVSPAHYFVATLWSSIGPALVPLVVGFVVGARFAPMEAIVVGAFLLLHSAVPHKEFRFIVPVLPLFVGVSAVGLAEILKKTRAPAWTPAGLAVLLGTLCARSALAARYVDFGQYEGTERASDSPWNAEEEWSLLLADAGRAPDVCGVLVLGARAAFTGGYSYLHRDVPLLYRHQVCDDAAAANFIIAARNNKAVPVTYRPVRERGSLALFRREGRCSPPPSGYDHMLEGADDMGLGRAPIRQPDPRELRITAGANAAAFVHGFSHGEHLECRHVRWAVGTSSQIAFDLQPVGGAYTLTFTAQPYWRSRPQSAAVSLNGTSVETFSLSNEWAGYQALIPRDRLRNGRNVLRFQFARAMRAEGDDSRRLAALFDQISLTPVKSEVDIDVGTSQGRQHLSDGFSGDERSGARTFAWSEGRSSSLILTLGGAGVPHVIELYAAAFRPIAPVNIAVAVNGQLFDTLEIGSRWTHAAVGVPSSVFDSPSVRVEFRYDRIARPREMDASSDDSRELAVMFDRITVKPLPESTALDLGTTSAHPHLGRGFSHDEVADGRSVVWNDGPVSTVLLGAPADKRRAHRLLVTGQGFSPALPQFVAVAVNDTVLGHYELSPAWQTAEVRVPPGTLADLNRVEFRFSRTIKPRDVSGESSDVRDLAVRFDRIELLPVESAEDETP